jgi:hypothetical protein
MTKAVCQKAPDLCDECSAVHLEAATSTALADQATADSAIHEGFGDS